ncbi:tRNA lysidine(34) synthetase TilS [Jannaschia marina]|uniref:tRNA lysidine(34) synthetase TilS n=1 Tax=Jannaschia marina TaxID=2741674 RepID=UPI0015C7F19E|nr:tRNA lysidine(34) synthetase TilS [Jannaschia marina]
MAAPDEPEPVEAIDRLLRGACDRRPETVGVAVSGGGDSVALLLAVLDWARPLDIVVRAATVDHGLRPEAATEAAWVADLCAARGIAHHTLTIDGLTPGPGVQARAREVRYAALADWAKEQRLGIVLLGHTGDDVAETLLMRLKRGTGLDGLARMPVWRRVGHVDFGRPFLEVSRSSLRAGLAQAGVTPLEDPSNTDGRFERARLREAMAALDLDARALARSAAQLDTARHALDALTATSLRDLFLRDAGDLILDLSAARAAPREILRRALLTALGWIAGGAAPRRAEQDHLIATLLGTPQPLTLAGCRIAPEGGGARLMREAARAAPPEAFTPSGTLWDGRWHVTGPAAPGATVGALGPDVVATDWRATGLPRPSLMASPAIRDAEGALLAAPLADPGAAGQFTATLRPPHALFD